MPKIKDTTFTIKDMPEFRDRDEVLRMPKEALLADAVKAMVEANYGSIIATEGKTDKIAGIVTERDLMTKVLYKNMNYKKLKLEDIMTARVQTANVNDSVTDCLRRMSNGRFRHMPVIDDEGILVGMMSQGDFVAYTWPELWKRVKEEANIVIHNKYQPLLILGGVLIYTAILLLFV
jgi:CBS domain-containing protein